MVKSPVPRWTNQPPGLQVGCCPAARLPSTLSLDDQESQVDWGPSIGECKGKQCKVYRVTSTLSLSLLHKSLSRILKSIPHILGHFRAEDC